MADKKGDATRTLVYLTVIQVLLVLIIAFQVNTAVGILEGMTEGAPAPTRPAAAPGEPVDVSADDDSVLGDEDAPVTIIEFSDYQCPFCAKFYTDSLQQIKKDYVETGKVKVIYRDFPLSFHPEATPSAIAAECAGEQGEYYAFHDGLFENQGRLGADLYAELAKDIGLDMSKFNTCLKDPKMAAEVQKDFKDGQASGVTGTPAFFVNGVKVSGAQPYSVFKQIIDAELAK